MGDPSFFNSFLIPSFLIFSVYCDEQYEPPMKYQSTSAVNPFEMPRRDSSLWSGRLSLPAAANTPGETRRVQLESCFLVFFKTSIEAETQSTVTPAQPEA